MGGRTRERDPVGRQWPTPDPQGPPRPQKKFRRPVVLGPPTTRCDIHAMWRPRPTSLTRGGGRGWEQRRPASAPFDGDRVTPRHDLRSCLARRDRSDFVHSPPPTAVRAVCDLQGHAATSRQSMATSCVSPVSCLPSIAAEGGKPSGRPGHGNSLPPPVARLTPHPRALVPFIRLQA